MNSSEYGNSFISKQRQNGPKVMKEEYHKNSHFKLGTAPGKDAFGRMSSHHFRPHKNVKRMSVSPDSPNLRASHFKLGNWVPSMRTTVKREFFAKTSDIPTVEE